MIKIVEVPVKKSQITLEGTCFSFTISQIEILYAQKITRPAPFLGISRLSWFPTPLNWYKQKDSKTPRDTVVIKMGPKSFPMVFGGEHEKKVNAKKYIQSLKPTVRSRKWMVGIRLFPLGMADFQGTFVSFQGISMSYWWKNDCILRKGLYLTP